MQEYVANLTVGQTWKKVSVKCSKRLDKDQLENVYTTDVGEFVLPLGCRRRGTKALGELEKRHPGGFWGALFQAPRDGLHKHFGGRPGAVGFMHFDNEKQLDETLTRDSHVVEFSPRNSPRYMVFDVDRKGNADGPAILAALLRILEQTIAKLGLKLIMKHVYILTASREDKVSFHVKCAQFVFKTKLQEQSFYRLLCETARQTPELFHEGKFVVDSEPIGKSRQMFRMMGQSKPGSAES